MEEIFRRTNEFKKKVFDKVQLELDQFGLLIYNASINQLVDVSGHEYFLNLGQKTQMETPDQAKINVFGAEMKVIIYHDFIHFFVIASPNKHARQLIIWTWFAIVIVYVHKQYDNWFLFI